CGLLEGAFSCGPVVHSGRISETPMNTLRIVWEDRAHFAHAVADRDDVVEGLVVEDIQMFGLLLADINAHSCHSPHRLRMHRGWLAAGAKGEHARAAEMSQECLGHLRTGTVMRAEEQDTSRCARLCFLRLYWFASGYGGV